MRKNLLIFLLVGFAAIVNAGELEDTYLDHYRDTVQDKTGFENFRNYVYTNIHHWNPEIGNIEVEAYCLSTWRGCLEDFESSKNYFYICIKEQGCRNKDLYERGGGYGYSGARSRTVYKATYGKTKKWVRRHPYETNEALAFWFHHYLKSNPEWWFSSNDPEKNRVYGIDIKIIKFQCDKSYEAAQSRATAWNF